MATRSAAIDLGNDVVFGASQIRVPVDLPFLCDQLGTRSGISVENTNESRKGYNSRRPLVADETLTHVKSVDIG